MSHFLIN